MSAVMTFSRSGSDKISLILEIVPIWKKKDFLMWGSKEKTKSNKTAGFLATGSMDHGHWQ